MQATLSTLLSVGAVLVLGADRAAAQSVPPTYKIVHMETPTSGLLRASAINNSNKVTGVAIRMVSGQNRAFPFVWTKKKGIDELTPPLGHTGASAEGINDNGEVVGFLTHASFGTRGYRWATNTGFIASAAPSYELFPELQNRLPLAISDNGRTICGQGYDGQSPAWVFDTVTHQVTDLIYASLFVEGINEATSVNAAGIVAGTISTRLPNGNVRPTAFRYTPGFAGWFIEPLPGPVATWHASSGNDINDGGDVVGHIFDQQDESAAMWDVAGNFTDLGLASSNEFVTIAKAVNEDRWIVGWSPNDHPLGLDTPFLWIDGTFYDVNDLVVGLGGSSFVYRAFDINDKGVILAQLVHFSPTVSFEDVVLMPD